MLIAYSVKIAFCSIRIYSHLYDDIRAEKGEIKMKKRMIRNLIGFMLANVLIIGLAGCGKSAGTGDRLDEIKKRGKLIVGTEGTYSPNSFHDESGELVGFDVEVAALIARELGVEVEYVETEWASIFAALDAGQIDVVVNEVGYTDERAQKYDFSEPYAFSRRCILVRGDNTDINSFEDLKGHTAANESSSLFGQMAEEYGAELDPVNAMAQSISEVLNGRADCTLNYETAFNDYMKEHPVDDVKIVAYADPEPSSYVPMLKGNSELKKAINDAIAKLQASGELAEVSKKYFNGVDVTAK